MRPPAYIYKSFLILSHKSPHMAGVLEVFGYYGFVLKLLPSSRAHDPLRTKQGAPMKFYSVDCHHYMHRNAGCGDRHVRTVRRSRSCTWEAV